VEEKSDPGRNFAASIVKEACTSASGDTARVLLQTGCIDALVNYLLTSSSVTGSDIDSSVLAITHFISRNSDFSFDYSTIISPIIAVFVDDRATNTSASATKRTSSYELGSRSNQLQRARLILVTLGRTWVGAFALVASNCGWNMINTTLYSSKDDESILVLLRAILEIVGVPRFDGFHQFAKIRPENLRRDFDTPAGEGSSVPFIDSDSSSLEEADSAPSTPQSFENGAKKAEAPNDNKKEDVMEPEYPQLSYGKPFSGFLDSNKIEESIGPSMGHETDCRFWIQIFQVICKPLLQRSKPVSSCVEKNTPWSCSNVSSSNVLDNYLAYLINGAYSCGLLSTLFSLCAASDSRVCLASRIVLTHVLLLGSALLPYSKLLSMVDDISNSNTAYRIESM
jgi:hypothetical protein